MTRISLQNIEVLSQLQLRAQTAPQNAILPRLAPGEVIRAAVVGNLGNGLYSLSLGGGEIVASSATPLTPGQLLSLQVSTTGDGPPTLHVLTLVEGRIAAVAERPTLRGLENQSAGAAARLPAAAASTVAARTLAIPTPDGTVPEGAELAQKTAAAPSVLLRLLNPQGPIARLLAERPELAPRIEQLLQTIVNRPDGAGSQVHTLAQEIARLAHQAPSTTGTDLQALSNRLLSQLVDAPLLDQPEALAQELASRFGDLARGLEGTITRLLRAATAVPANTPGTTAASNVTAGNSGVHGPVATANPPVAPAAVPTPVVRTASGVPSAPGPASEIFTVVNDGTAILEARASATEPPALPAQPTVASSTPGESVVVPAATSGTDKPAATASPTPMEHFVGTARPLGEPRAEAGSEPAPTPPPARVAPDIVQGTFDGDLKGQLIELRSQLEQLARTQPETRPAVQHALARTDQLLDLVTAQQIRNVDGLNQYVYTELPIDPRTGIGEARLQVFYRKQQRPTPTIDDQDRFTVALFLNLTRLGDVLAVVTGIGDAAQVSFTVESPTAEKLLAAESDGLREGLLGAGYSGVTVTVRRPSPTTNAADRDAAVWDGFLSSARPEGGPGGRLNAKV